MRYDRGRRERVESAIRPPIARAFVVAIALTLLVPLMIAYGDAGDHASSGDWIYLVTVSVGGAVLAVVIIVESHRDVNPHTGLRRTKRRRMRGPPTR
ncbi:MAG TPA: hypothetical protein VMS64_04420 [Candidatus Methylomirabilis sp.]|nr:hypothetical protein [Candidatus Methylomirabilis sp.]